MRIRRLLITCIIIISFSSACQSDQDSFFARIKCLSWIKQIRIPYLTRRVSVDCSVELINRPLTIEDIAEMIGQRIYKIGGDLSTAADVAKGVALRLLNYMKENPLDATLIAGSVIAVYFITRSIIRSMSSTKCPCSRCQQGDTNNCFINC